MTNTEKKQSQKTFVNAGKKAFKMGIDASNNPYKKDWHPYGLLWSKGFSAEASKNRFVKRSRNT